MKNGPEAGGSCQGLCFITMAMFSSQFQFSAFSGIFGTDVHSVALFWLTKFVVGLGRFLVRLRVFDKLLGRTNGRQVPNPRLSPDLVLWLSFGGSTRS